MEKEYQKCSISGKWARRIGYLVGFAGALIFIAASVVLPPVCMGIGCVWAAGCAYFEYRQRAKPSSRQMIEMQERVRGIHGMLQRYITFGKHVQGDMGELQKCQAKIEPVADFILSDDKWEDVLQSLDTIMNHLNDYTTHGKKAAYSIERACDEYQRGY